MFLKLSDFINQVRSVIESSNFLYSFPIRA